MSWADLPLLVVLVLLLSATAALSAAETALFSLSHADRIRLTKTKPAAAARISRLLAAPRRTLVALLLLTTVAVVGYTVISTYLAEKFTIEAVDIAFRLVTLLAMVIFAEILPKTFASSASVSFAAVLARPLEIAVNMLNPVSSVLDAGLIAPLSRVLRPAGAGEPEPLTRDELEALLDLAGNTGGIDKAEERILGNVLGLSELRVRDVMAPRIDVKWLPESASETDVIKLVAESGHTKFPVCRGSLDGGVVGLLNARAFLHACSTTNTRQTAGRHARPVLFVPDRARLDRLLETFRERREHVAVVVDEFGQVAGLVVIDDVVGRLVVPESVTASEGEPMVRRMDERTWLVSGRLSVRHWDDLFGADRWRHALARSPGAASQVATLAGLVFAALGRLPKRGDVVHLGNLLLIVESMSGRTVESVRVQLESRSGGVVGVAS